VPRAAFYSHIDAANGDIKGFTQDFYHRTCAARVADVLDTLCYLRHETEVWLGITTLLIPGRNDSAEEIDAETAWIATELDTDMPLHFSAFHPANKMMDVPSTPAATLTRARRIALGNGLRYVYTGNVHDTEGGTTTCPGCGAEVIVRDWYAISAYLLEDDGTCRVCGTQIPGVYDGPAGRWGGRRLPVSVAYQRR
jgi:pyruvate formate lyase activating enzyme